MPTAVVTCGKLLNLTFDSSNLNIPLLQCLFDVILRQLDIKSQCVEINSPDATSFLEKHYFGIPAADSTKIENYEPKPQKLPKSPYDYYVLPTEQPLVRPEPKKSACPCRNEEDIKRGKLEECVCELAERLSILECQTKELNEHFMRFVLEFRRKIPCCHAVKIDSSSSSPAKDENQNKSGNAEIKIAPNAKLKTPLSMRSGDIIPIACRHLCDPVSNMACKLLTNSDFIKEILERVSDPCIETILTFQDHISKLNMNFLEFLKTAKAEFEKTPTVEDCMTEITKLNDKMLKKDDELLYALEEVQDMLDAKLDKWHIPAMKKYVTDTINSLKTEIKDLKASADCPKAFATTLTSNCLSCNQKTCQRVTTFTAPLLPGILAKPTKKFSPNAQGANVYKCRANTERYCGGYHTIRLPVERLFRPNNLVDQFKGKMASDNFAFAEGVDGKIYRATPDPPPQICFCEKPKKITQLL